MIQAVLLLVASLPQSTLPAAPPQSTLPARQSAPADPYAAAYDRALAENKPLIVWCGGNFCSRCVEDSKQEFVHHFAPDGWEGQRGPATVLLVPHGGELYRAATVTNWTVGSPDWGHVPSARRLTSQWRARAVAGDPSPLVLLDFGGGGKWGMTRDEFWSKNVGGGYRSGGYGGKPSGSYGGGTRRSAAPARFFGGGRSG